jgi:hypothetical protein
MKTNLKLEHCREAMKTPPVGAPAEPTAKAVWDVVGPVLRQSDPAVGFVPVELEDICSSLLRRFTPPEQEDVKLTAIRALVVAIDAVIGASLDRKTLTRNVVADALARRWSPAFRTQPAARTLYDLDMELVPTIRREMLEAGVDLNRMWLVVRDGVPGLFATHVLGGAGHAGGRAVKLARRRSPVYQQYTRARLNDRDYHRPRTRERLLLADAPTPPLKISKRVAGGTPYDVMPVAERTKKVIQILEGTRLFLNLGEVYKDARAWRLEVKNHRWPAMERAWRKANAGLKGQPRIDADGKKHNLYEEARREFRYRNWRVSKEYGALLGRWNALRGLVRQIRRHRRSIKTYDGVRRLEIKNAFYKSANRRYHARFFGPDAVSSKKDRERDLILPAQPDRVVVDDTGHRRRYEGSAAIYAQSSPRGRWFDTHATAWDQEHVWVDDDTGEVFPLMDDWAGDHRPLVGIDCCASMIQIMCMVLGWRDEERAVATASFKDGLVAGMRTAGAAGVFKLPTATDLQLRKAAGELAFITYGAGLRSRAKELNSDPDKYGSEWGSWTNLDNLIERGAALNANLSLLKRLRDEYLPVCRAVADAAVQRDPYAGVTFRDPFDDALVRWHAPARSQVEIPNSAGPLFVNAPGVIQQQRVNGRLRNVFGPVRPNERGEYPVDPGALRRRIAPALIHTLDAAFAGHVIENLYEQHNVRDIVVIHDCFLVASDAEPALYEAVTAASEPWFRSLGSFFQVFEDYLPGHPEVRRWRETWERRVAAGNDWPAFLMKPEVTYKLADDQA